METLKIGKYYRFTDRKYSWNSFVGVFTGTEDGKMLFRKSDMTENAVSDEMISEDHEGEKRYLFERCDRQTFIDALEKSLEVQEKKANDEYKEFQKLKEYRNRLRFPFGNYANRFPW